MKNLFNYIFISAISISLWSCVPTLQQTNYKYPNLPTEYTETTQDTNNISNWNTNVFFADSLLKNLIQIGLDNNPDLQNAYLQIEIAKNNYEQAKASRLPEITVGVAPSLRRFGLHTMDGAGNITTEIKPDELIPIHLPDFYVGFSASWEVDFLAKLKKSKQAAQLRLLSSVQAINWLKSNLVAEIAKNYYELVALDAESEILKNNIKLQENILEVLKIQKEAAQINILAIQQFQAQILENRAIIAEIEQMKNLLENNINFLLQRYPQSISRSSTLTINNLAIQAGIPSQLLANRPDIKAAELELLATRFDLSAAKKAFFPSINFNLNMGLQAFEASLLTNPNSWAYGLFSSITQPILNRKLIKTNYQIAHINQQQALLDYQKAIFNSFYEVFEQMKYLQNLEQIYSLRSEQTIVLEDAIKTTNLLFQANRVNYLDILFLQQNILEAQLAMNRLKKEQLIALIYLYKALGGGWQ